MFNPKRNLSFEVVPIMDKINDKNVVIGHKVEGVEELKDWEFETLGQAKLALVMIEVAGEIAEMENKPNPINSDQLALTFLKVLKDMGCTHSKFITDFEY